MRLVEFQGATSRQLSNVVIGVSHHLGKLERIGGPKRLYEVGDDQLAAVFVIHGTVKALGFAWSRSASAVGVSTIYLWNDFDINRSPDAALDLPVVGDLEDMLPAITKWIDHPTFGKFLAEGKSLNEMARRTNDMEFMQMARTMYGDKANNLTMPEMMACAQQNDVQIPTSIRSNPKLKTDAHHWNLSSGAAPPAAPAGNHEAGLSDALGGPVENDPTQAPGYEDALALAKAKTVKKLAATPGKIYLMGRKPNGAWFRIPGLEELSAQLERMLTRQLQAGGGGRQTMEEQYEQLIERVKLVAGGQSAFIKSLLITGAPSSGKTFTVMDTIKKLGLTAGVDFVVKKGKVTPATLYRLFIEQVNGMIVFDDCDSVRDSEDSINMLKGALDTDPVREISYDVKGMMNTAVMDPKRRDQIVEAASRILRGAATAADVWLFEPYVRNKKGKEFVDDVPVPKHLRNTWADEDAAEEADDFAGDEGEDAILNLNDYELGILVQDYVSAHLPNKIDFKGKIIFISNLPESDWDTAILTRAFTINMDFSSEEMLNYIDKIKAHIKTPNISDEEKQEVIDYLRELYTTGKLKRQINFRLVQQCFDLRLAGTWRKMMAQL